MPEVNVTNVEDPSVAPAPRREWVRIILTFGFLALFAGIIGYGCYEVTAILGASGCTMDAKRQEIDIVKDWVAIILAPTAALLGTAVAFFYLERERSG